MKTTAIIAEYNPFHNGHNHQISVAKEITGCDNIIIAMSGNYVQRGEAAIYNKYQRAKWAVTSGCDLVLELPTAFSTGSAELFAYSAVDLLNKTGIVDYLVFGCEEDSIDKLLEYANVFVSEPEQYKLSLKSKSREGMVFPKARAMALSEYLNDSGACDILSKPNNILAVEYLKAIIQTGSSIKPIGIKRTDNGYNSETINGKFASATAVRSLITKKNESINLLADILPRHVFDDIAFILSPVVLRDFSDMYFYSLITNFKFEKYSDISEDLSNKINNLKSEYENIDSFLDKLLSKDETLAHLKRSLLHILFGITSDNINSIKAGNYNKYMFPLAINSANSGVLKELKQNCDIPLINKFGDFYKSASNEAKLLLDINQKADSIYNMISSSRGNNR
ncbi:MAG: nucleotidyltransferase family protein, partial [Lachnospiraceae bacterium]|nr:nucleotidyltransferase family protein [Lachnospiraceae bacterium]